MFKNKKREAFAIRSIIYPDIRKFYPSSYLRKLKATLTVSFHPI